MHPIEQLRYVARASGADAGLLVEEAASALAVFERDPAAMLTASRRLLTRQPAVGPLWWLCARMVTAGTAGAGARSVARSVGRELREDRTGRHVVDGLPDGATVAIVGWPDLTMAALPRRGDLRVLVVNVAGQGMGAARRLARHDVEAVDVDASQLGGVVEESDVVVIEAGAAGDAAALVEVGSVPLAATARALGKPVWLATGVGRRVPERYWRAIVERVDEPDRPRFLAAFEVLALGSVDLVVTPDGPTPVADLEPPDVPLAPELLVELG